MEAYDEADDVHDMVENYSHAREIFTLTLILRLS